MTRRIRFMRLHILRRIIFPSKSTRQIRKDVKAAR